mgnify:CR=1 FL=1
MGNAFKVIEGDSSPRGRIYDRNYNIIVDNKSLKTIRQVKRNYENLNFLYANMSDDAGGANG